MFTRILKCAAAMAIAASMAGPAEAASTYQSGHIINVSFAGDQTMIMLDTGVPDNCTGTPYGWMIIPGDYKPMTAFVLGLWMRGDETQVTVTVYTDGNVLNNYCRINQIDPAG